jgi:hypothetical protein
MFLAFFLALLAAPTMDDAPLIAVALVTICAAFYSGRNLPLAVICVTIPLAHHLGPALRRLPRAERIGTSTAPNSFLVCGAALAIATAGGLLSNRLKTFAPVPSGAVAFMEDHDLHGNILNFFSWGEYLIWHCSPSSRVFIDGRTELVYPDNLLREYALFLYGLPGGTKILSRYPHDFLLLSPDTKDYGSVATDPRWKLIYHDSASALFAKARSPIAKTFERPVQGQATSYFP